MINLVSSSRYKLNKKLIRKHAQDYVIQYGGSAEATLNIVFVGKRKMLDIATTYKHEAVALPVLSFPYKQNGEDNLLGEIFICYPQAILLAAEKSKRVDELLLWLIEHGVNNLFK